MRKQNRLRQDKLNNSHINAEQGNPIQNEKSQAQKKRVGDIPAPTVRSPAKAIS